ncbi:hypothetical protein [Streptomyces sp. TLI_171]|uniref:hypothetical protein n=1 Tax=Streptomyces sp. TLI_171 TaxID=1938859 RepID=UPI000C37F886|nr:hypothetical protein [Streptomyces sp. TLI_171]RKE23466.1 hypothetical protein BX266_6937 [Streptomyces sp. TLI_171]
MAGFRIGKLGILIGPIVALIGVLYCVPLVHVRHDYAGATRVEATVLVADYDRHVRGASARAIVVAAPDPLPLDDLAGAPDDLVPGERVTVLTRPGRAVLADQVDWTLFALPVLVVLVGLAITWRGVTVIRRDPPPGPTGPTGPDAWF